MPGTFQASSIGCYKMCEKFWTLPRIVSYDWLNQYLFESLEEIQNFATAWLWSYNNERPNMGIGGITPAMKLGGSTCSCY